MAITAREQTYRNFIGGRWQESATGRLVANRDPATGEVLGQVPLSSREEARAAVEAAGAAFPKWRDTPGPVRGRILFKVMEIFEREMPRLGEALT
ncbi:MAG: aldehyde dehydrogenase family protein, partial [Armatimonadota bacterium]